MFTQGSAVPPPNCYHFSIHLIISKEDGPWCGGKRLPPKAKGCGFESRNQPLQKKSWKVAYLSPPLDPANGNFAHWAYFYYFKTFKFSRLHMYLIKPEHIGPLFQVTYMYNISKLLAKSYAWTENLSTN